MRLTVQVATWTQALAKEITNVEHLEKSHQTQGLALRMVQMSL